MSDQLKKLFDRLNNNIDSDGQLDNLINALGRTSRVGKALATLAEDKAIPIMETSVSHNTQKSVVFLNGEVDEFGFGTLATIQAVFTENDRGLLHVQLLVTRKIEWSFAGVPWIIFKNGTLDIEMVDEEDSVSKSTLEVTTFMGEKKKEVTFQANFPIYQFELMSAREKPSLIDLQRFLGGINLNRSLPSNLLEHLELRGLKFFYDKTKKQMVWMKGSLTSSGTWEVGPFKIKAGYVEVKVGDPVQSRTPVIDFRGNIEYTSEDSTELFILEAKGSATPDFELSIFQKEQNKWIFLSSLEDLVGQQVTDVFGNTVKASGITASFTFKKSRIESTASVILDAKIPLNKSIFINEQNAGELYDFCVKVSEINKDKTISISAKAKLPGNVNLKAEAEYMSKKGWIYSAKIEDADIYSILNALIGVNEGSLPNLSAICFKAVVPKDEVKEWEITAISENWEIPGISKNGEGVRALMNLLVQDDKKPIFTLCANFLFYGAPFDICCNFRKNGNETEKTYELAWEKLNAEYDPNKMIAKFLLKDVNLGSIIESAVSWVTGNRFGLASPWDQLHKVSMEGASFDVCFEEELLSFTKNLNYDLFFAHVSSITVSYKPKKVSGIQVALDVTYKWGDSVTLIWDATNPSETPAPPGEGKEYFMLRLLALGHHISTSKMPYPNVKEALKDIRDFPDDPLDGNNSNIAYNADAGWLIATDFSMLKDMMTLELIFNDPTLYGLRLAFGKEFLKGLEFEIMYQKISDSIGLYQAELTLPYELRYWEYGAYSITMPSFGIGIYTNGDFKVDIGFPHNMNFERSFTIQTMASGIPVIGSVGFYLNKLSGVTSTRLPVSSIGHFKPVIELGLGMRLGIGKEFQKGPLKAGISVVVIAIIEGVMARWNRWKDNKSEGKKGLVQKDSFYFWLQGTAGIQGKLFGTVDLGLVAADIDLSITLATQLTYEAYRNVEIAVIADVDISVRIKIRCGPIKVRITMKYAANIQENFELQTADTAPWDEQKLALKSRPLAIPMFDMNWDGLCPIEDEEKRHRLQVRLVPTPSIRSDETAQNCIQKNIYNLVLAIETMPDLPNDGNEAKDWSSFEVLCRQIFRWLVAACKKGNLDETEADKAHICVTELCRIKDILGWKDSKKKNSWTPIPIEVIEEFMKGQFFVDIAYILPEDTASSMTNPEKPATFFPVAPQIVLTVPNQLDSSKPPIHNYRFSDVACAKQDYLKCLEDHMKELAIEVGRETRPASERRTLINGETISIADFCFADYILLIARFLCQSSIDALDNFDYPLQCDLTVSKMANVIKNNGVEKEEKAFNCTHLFEALAERKLVAVQPLVVKEAKYRITGDVTIKYIVEKVYNSLFTLEEFASLNKTNKELLLPGVTVTYKPNPSDQMIKVLEKGDTLYSLLRVFNCTMAELIDRSTVFTDKILQFGTILEIPIFTYVTKEGDTLRQLTSLFGVSFTNLANESADTVLRNLFEDVSPITLGKIDKIKSCLLLEKLRSRHKLRAVSGLVSRVFMHGLRLPTEGIIWGEDIAIPQSEECGLYVMTGQQFDLPDFDQTLSLSLDATDVPWITFKGNEAGNK